MPKRNVIKRETFHYKWSKSHEPVLNIKPGDTVHFEVNEVTSWQLSKKSKPDELQKIDWDKLYPLAGPVYVEGAEPGDALVVNIKVVQPIDWGWSAILPGLGLLEEFGKPVFHVWKITRDKYLKFKSGIRIRQRPFCGVLGVAPPEEGYFDVLPPGKHGGNMDIRHLTAGTQLILPVWVTGALFSTSDVHAAQGDGEVCVTAIECAGNLTATFDLKKDANLKSPCYFTSPEKGLIGGQFVTTGISPDLMTATKLSVRNMIEYLTTNTQLSKEDAYILCSVAGDLRIHEIVDSPNWVVGLSFEKELLKIN